MDLCLIISNLQLISLCNFEFNRFNQRQMRKAKTKHMDQFGEDISLGKQDITSLRFSSHRDKFFRRVHWRTSLSSSLSLSGF